MARAELWDEGKTIAFECPGCGMTHALRIRALTDKRPSWIYTGTLDAPTLSPSILSRFSRWIPSAEDPDILDKIHRGEIKQTRVDEVCHSFVRNGRIQFLNDCTHALKGQTVDLPEVKS